MNEHEKKLVAAYQAGEDVSEQLLLACRKNHELLKELAEFVVIEKLLKFDGQDDNLFVEEFEQKLLLEQQDDFTKRFDKKLAAIKEVKQFTYQSRFSFIQIAAMVCLLVIPSLFMINIIPTKPEVTVVGSLVKYTGSNEIAESSSIHIGKFSLHQGYAELLLNNNVQLTIEAPITLDFKSVELVSVLQGNLVADVPEQAIGFTVLTPSSEIIDLGTEFAVAVNENGTSEVHVLKGEVKARGLQEKYFVNLFKDEARAFNLHKKMSVIESSSHRFLRVLPGKSATKPDFIHWSFDDESTITKATGQGFNADEFSGALKALNKGGGPRYENGQFGKGLFFDGNGAYVETAFEGIGGNNPRTVTFWAKIPADFTVNNGYGMISWGLFEKGSAWQISSNPEEREGPIGRIRIGTKGAPVVGITDLRDHRWHHIAVVMYGGSESDTSTHILLYVDGQLENTSYKAVTKINTVLDSENSRPLTFGRNIAFTNTNKDNQYRKGNFFRGWLDEIFIFNAALDQQQIINLMKNNSIDVK